MKFPSIFDQSVTVVDEINITYDDEGQLMIFAHARSKDNGFCAPVDSVAHRCIEAALEAALPQEGIHLAPLKQDRVTNMAMPERTA